LKVEYERLLDDPANVSEQILAFTNEDFFIDVDLGAKII